MALIEAYRGLDRVRAPLRAPGAAALCSCRAELEEVRAHLGAPLRHPRGASPPFLRAPACAQRT